MRQSKSVGVVRGEPFHGDYTPHAVRPPLELGRVVQARRTIERSSLGVAWAPRVPHFAFPHRDSTLAGS